MPVPVDPASEPPAEPSSGERSTLLHSGRVAWSLVGLAIVAVLAGIVASRLMLVLVPVVLALFPATLLVPVADRLRRVGLPNALASLVSILLGLGLLTGVVWAMVPLVAAELPDLVESATEGIGELATLVEQSPLGIDITDTDRLLEEAGRQLADAGNAAARAVDVVFTAIEFVAGTLLLAVTLFFYLKDGRRLGRGLVDTFPSGVRTRADRLLRGAWDTLGRYFRGQLLVALVDAVFIGIGLAILGVPLALPLAVLIFFGGMFPIIGAVVSGSLAVLVALADTGLVTALVVLGLVVAVQQIEGNVLEPLILGRIIPLHPLVIILSITAGSVLLGILGAFLAVPVAAITARVVEDLRTMPA